MFMFVLLAINAVLFFLMFGIYSKLDELSRAIKRVAALVTALPVPPSE